MATHGLEAGSLAETRRHWWALRRWRYNAWLLGALAATCVSLLVINGVFDERINPPIVDAKGDFIGRDNDLSPALCFGCGFGAIGLALANLCYGLGPLVEQCVPAARVATYRRWAWRAGVAFACAVPLALPASLLVQCLFFPDSFDLTPIVVGSPATSPAR